MNSGGLIRVLDVHPAKNGDIFCTTRTVSLGEDVAYEALSYVWGHSSRTKCIHIADRDDVWITPGLFEALRRLRHSDAEIRTLWIDQLCIDQDNVKEKTHQVNLMRRIYIEASRCLIWFGELSSEAEAINLDDAKAALDFIALCAELSKSREHGIVTPGSLVTLTQLQGARKAFQAFSGNPWWTRIWTVQEVSLPSRSTVYWGPLSISWITIASAASNLCSSQVPLLHETLYAFHDLCNNFTGSVRGLSIARAGESSLNMLQRWRYRDATDPRDKVYALMGLLKPKSLPSVLSCDYELDTANLYSKVTRDLIDGEQGLRPLVGLRPIRDPSYPSWAIDLGRRSEVRASYAWWDHSRRYAWFDACNGKALVRTEVEDEAVLSLHGVHVGRVKLVGSVTYHEDVMAGETLHEDLINQLDSWKEVLKQHLQGCDAKDVGYPSGSSYDNAFWLTMIGNLVTDEFPKRSATANDVESVANYLQHGSWSEVLISIRCMALNHAFFVTEGGYIGIGPPNLVEGDEIWVFAGGKTPFVLRPFVTHQDDGLHTIPRSFTLIGDAYVHGIMYGEACQHFEDLQQKVYLC